MKLVNIQKRYGEKIVFQDFSLQIAEGEILCVLGPSGSGKTTLLNILCGLCSCDGEKQNAPDNAAYIFQEHRLLPNLTVAENLRYAGGMVENIEKILQQIGLEEKKNCRPKQLSGGEKQRVSIARAFLNNAPLILMDEPFSSLDTALKIKMIKLFCKLWQQKKQTAVFVTHDIEEALMFSHRIVVLGDGKIIADVRTGIENKQRFPLPYGEENELRAILLNILLTQTKSLTKGENI